MSQLSSTTLFNFTDRFEHLKDNLLNGFYATTAYEKLPKRDNGYSVPMVCFCDIPLGMIKEHLDWYGNFGLGIRRSYARLHGVTPVFYTHSDSKLISTLLYQGASNSVNRNLFPLLKQFLGNQSYRNGKPKRKKFYDEHEWRFIPPGSKLQLHLNIKKVEAEKDIIKQTLRMPITNYEAIEYIIIEKSKDIKPLLSIFDTIVRKNKDVNRELLISKILTVSQIKRDF